jgi:hypothetical protein
MESQTHTLANLFAQLGLPNDQAPSKPSSPHAPLPDAIPLAEAAFWTPSQAAFLKAEIAEDADWSAVVDSLNLQLRRRLTRLLRQQEALGVDAPFVGHLGRHDAVAAAVPSLRPRSRARA